MRALTAFLMAAWIAVIASQAAAWAMPMPAAAPMDCDCPHETMPCMPDDDDRCMLDPGCMARCTFVQPALDGPQVNRAAILGALVLTEQPVWGAPQRSGTLPFRPPKTSILV